MTVMRLWAGLEICIKRAFDSVKSCMHFAMALKGEGGNNTSFQASLAVQCCRLE